MSGQNRVLKLSKRDSMIGGVCGGIAEYFGWDSMHVRIGYVLLSLCSAGFPGILLYIILWFIMPPDDRLQKLY